MRKVLLAPNEAISFDSPHLKWPLLGSTKFDGWRCIICDGQLWTRNGKIIHNQLLPEYLKQIIDFCNDEHVVLDGELWCPGVTFQDIQSLLASYHKPITMPLVYHVFDYLTRDEWLNGGEAHFDLRAENYEAALTTYFAHTKPVMQVFHATAEDAKRFYQGCIDRGYEGSVLRDPRGIYKHGRSTLNQGLMFKFKKWITADVRIVGFKQGQRMREEVADGPRDRDIFGHLETSNRKDDYEEVDELGSVEVELQNGIRCFVRCAKEFDGPKITWENREQFMNRWCEIRYQAAGVKIKPRTGHITRMRIELEDE